MSLISSEVLSVLGKTMHGVSKDYIIENILTKTQLKKLDKKVSKKELVELAKERASKSETLCKKIVKDNPNLFSLHPSRVEELLGITTTERKRWQSEDKFKIDYYDTFSKYGKSFDIPMFNFMSVTSIKPEKIDSWREKHNKDVASRRSKGAKTAVETRNKNKSIVEQYKREYDKTYNSWLKESEKVAATMNLANWSMWVSRLAKTFQVKSLSAISKSKEYTEKKDLCYELKEEAMELLSEHSEYSTLSVYIPYNKDKVYVKNLCDNHYNDWCESRQYYYYPFGEYVQDNMNRILKCKHCIKDIQEDYYTLYYLSVSDKNTDTNFSFHIPFPIGKSYLPDINTLPKVMHEEQEGIFRFGRSILDDESVIYTEKRVFSEFSKAIETFKMVYNIEED